MEKQRADGVPVCIPEHAAGWRAYLATYHADRSSTWLVIFKKNSAQANLTYEEARDEALCFGWIDSKPNKRDANSYYLFFARRNPKSNWSAVNKARIKALAAAGRLAQAGIEMVTQAKKSGTWDALNDVDNLIVPADLAEEFNNAPPNARSNWEAFPPSVRRGILEWIFTAKRSATRQNRIKKTVDMASRNERANQYRK